MMIRYEEQVSMIAIPSASAMRERAEERAQEIAREEALAKLVREAQEQERKAKLLARLPEIIALIMEDIAKITERGHTCTGDIEWYENSTKWGMKWNEFEELAPVLAEVLGKAGYKMSTSLYWYSKSWRNRSGKVFWGGNISWAKA